jgi:L-asparaginase II
MSNPVLLEVTRSGVVESHHTGAVAIVDANGKRHTAIGDIDTPVYPRSAIKSMQALALVETGAADRYRFGNAELALVCASHNGEERHVETARRMLAAAGRSEADLECGGHPPTYRPAAEKMLREGQRYGRIHDNCSGKHSGFICLACGLGLDPRGYTDPAHPAQREVEERIFDVLGAKLEPPGVDGCSAPAYRASLTQLAFGFARMVTGQGLDASRAKAARRLIDACTAEPFMVAGTGRYDTDILTAFGKRVFVKGGAEGVICAALPELGVGIAIKADDGAGRAPEPLLSAAIEALLEMNETERAALEPRRVQPVKTRRGVTIGEIRPVAGLTEKIREGRR